MLFCDILTIPYNDNIIYNARYLDWMLTTPIQLTILGNMGKLTNTNIYILIVMDILMIASGWIGQLYIYPYQKWIFLLIGTITYLPIYSFLFEDFNYQVIHEFSGKYIADNYYFIGRYLLLVWLFYPIIWILDNESNVFQNNYSCIAYTILDFFSKFIFSLWILKCVNNRKQIQSVNNTPV
jgi:bacteriorhodopsin